MAALAVFKPCPQNKIHTYIYKNIGLGLGQSWDRTRVATEVLQKYRTFYRTHPPKIPYNTVHFQKKNTVHTVHSHVPVPYIPKKNKKNPVPVPYTQKKINGL